MFVAAAIGGCFFLIKICSVSPPNWYSSASWTSSAEDTLELGVKKKKNPGEQMRVYG